MTDQPRLQGLIHVADIPVAFSLLSRLPVSLSPETAAARSAKAVWAYPLVGGLLALIAGVIGLGLSTIGIADGPVCVVVLILLALLTGGLHEDGLADTADGLFGGRSKEHALEIIDPDPAAQMVVHERPAELGRFPPGPNHSPYDLACRDGLRNVAFATRP